jgi:D-alanyl-D-alanine carboxypeptidase/D-alanyl-D-alanine-endopeptidase (penicillin-binding protein 4)
MKRKLNNIKIVGFLAFTIVWLGFNFGATTAAQVTPRERVLEKPTPKQTPTAIPTVSPTPIQAPTPVPVQTLAGLQSKIRVSLMRPEFRRGTIGVKIISLDTGKTVFEENAEKYFMPASNMKSYTIAAALERLSPDFRFVTSVFAAAMPDANGAIRGDLTIYGRGDVSISTAFYDGDYYKGLDALAQKIVQAGVKKIEGNLIGDESYFSGDAIPAGWEWDDLQWYYGAEISALPVNDNAVDLTVKPASVNSPCIVQILPANAIIKIANRCATSAFGAKRDVQVLKKLDQNTIEISGTIPSGDKGFQGSIAVSRPAQLFVELLRGLLIQKGVAINGQNKLLGARDKTIFTASTPVTPTTPLVEITRLESPPLSFIAAKTLKPSQNTYTETILRALGEQAGDKSNPKETSAERGLGVVRNFLLQAGIPPDSVIQSDGSGLSRHDLVTPASAVQLFSYMSKSRYANVWRDALTVGAVDGTLQNRFKETAAAGNVRGKTGTIDQVSSLSGYVNSASGEKFVFSIIVNGVGDVKARQAAIDEIVLSVANFNGRTN